MLSPRRKWTVFTLVFLGIIISYIDRGNLGLSAQLLMHDLKLPPERMGLLLSVFFWTYAFFQLPAGYLVDRFGIRMVYAIAFTLWSLASASIAISRGPNDIIASRLFLGFAESIGPIASLSFIRRYFPAQERGLPTSLYVGGQTLGPALGTLLGAGVLTRYGWRPLFAITGLGALIWVPFWLALAPRTAAPASPNGQPPAVPLLALLADPSVWALSAAIFFSSYFWWFVMTWMPGYLTLARGLSTADMGRTFSLPLFAMTVTNLVTGWAADRYVAKSGQRIRVRVIFGSIGLLAASALLLLNFSQISVLPVLLVCICGFGVASASLWTLAQTIAAGPFVGRFIGYLNTLSQLAGAAAPLITGWTLGPQNNFHFALWMAGLAPLLAAACLVMVRARPPFR
jgi:ACS family D-galactonate transporter-like MFS transporter